MDEDTQIIPKDRFDKLLRDSTPPSPCTDISIEGKLAILFMDAGIAPVEDRECDILAWAEKVVMHMLAAESQSEAMYRHGFKDAFAMMRKHLPDAQVAEMESMIERYYVLGGAKSG